MKQIEKTIAQGDSAAPPIDTTRPRVLLVDDQPARLLTYEAILEGVGVECIRAHSGKEAFEKLLRTSFALILMDVSMPEMDGFETARLIREHPRFEHTPIIFVTGVHVTELDSLRGYQVGAIDYISVPIVPEILRSKVALLVELYRRRAELETLNRDLETTRAGLEAERNKTLASSQAQLHASEARYRAIFEHPMALTVVLEAVRDESNEIVDWRYIDANDHALRRLGYSREALLNRRLSATEPDRAGFLRPLCFKVLSEHTPQQYEMRFGEADYLMCLFPMGEYTIVRSGWDITAQKQSEAALRLRDTRSRALLKLADRFRTLSSPGELAYAAAQVLGETLDASRCGYGTVDPQSEIIDIERDWRAPGVPSLAGVLHFRDYGSYIDDLKRGDAVVCADAERDSRTSSTADALKLILVRAFINMPIMEHGEVVALLFVTFEETHSWPEEEVALIRDVAERTRIAVQRRRSEEALAADLAMTGQLRDLSARLLAEGNVHVLLEEILAVAISIANADGGTLQLLDESTQQLRFAATKGLDEKLISQFAEVNASSQSSCGRALACGRRTWAYFDVPESADPDGSLRFHAEHGLRAAQSTPLISRSGTVLGMVSTHWRERWTLSDRETHFLDLLARQAADLIERTRAEEVLRRSEQQLRDTDRRKDEFIAILAHELRNPLVPIRTGVELLRKARERADIVESVRPMMERQVGHIVRMIDDLLDVSRITSGKLELQRRPATLSSLVGAAIEMNREAITVGNHVFTVNVPEPRWILNVDPTRFTQIISNLLQNAAKFTPPGGRVGLDAVIVPEDGANPPQLVLKVIDSGEGISDVMRPRLFDLFAQASTTSQSGRSGLGIGLAISRRLVEMHGGTIEARSAGANQGSEFTIRLPAPREFQPQNPSHTRNDEVLSGLRVMIIDDNADAADSVGMLVGAMGCAVRVAYDGPSGLSALAGFDANVVLLDIGMPGIDGYETCRRIRDRYGKAVSIVAVTGWGQERDKQLAIESGFDAHLTKPADPAKLEELICALSKRAQ
jgi:signal transduction histidine kinase/DNA-binding response OmpR family regulator